MTRFGQIDVCLRVEVAMASSFSYLLAHLGKSPLQSVRFQNPREVPAGPFSFTVSFGTLARMVRHVDVESIPPYGEHVVTSFPPVQFDDDEVRTMVEAREVQVDLSIRGDSASLTGTSSVVFLPVDAWDLSAPIALASFTMRSSQAAQDVVRMARPALRRLTGTESFATAVEKSVDDVVHALYETLRSEVAIKYENEPRTYARDWQRIRTPEVVLRDQEGTCLDLSLLLASCLERVHVDPLIVVLKTDPVAWHAIVGYWRKSWRPLTAVITDPLVLADALGTDSVAIVDATGVSRGNLDIPFEQARRTGRGHVDRALANHALFGFAIDVRSARMSGVLPLPLDGGLQLDRAAALAVAAARRNAQESNSKGLQVRHLLIGLIQAQSPTLVKALRRLGKDPDLISAIAGASIRPQVCRGNPLAGKGWKAAMQRARRSARLRGAFAVDERDLTIAMLEAPSQIDKVLARVGLDREKCTIAISDDSQESSETSDWFSASWQ